MPWPGDIESVTITWMDGQQETYPRNSVGTKDGELRISTVYKGHIGISGDTIKGERGFPLSNIRCYVINRVN